MTRLLCVRTALFILSEPSDPAGRQQTPLGEDWLSNRYTHARVNGWQTLFRHAVVDPLFALTTELPRSAVNELGDRSLGWPPDLRRRWTYAAAVGAVGGYVF